VDALKKETSIRSDAADPSINSHRPDVLTGGQDLRSQAETKIKAHKKKAASFPAIDADTQRLFHELEVHQIELEMQNEELVQARAEVETLLRLYTDLYDYAPVGYFTLARDGTIRQVNLAGANLLGAERGKLIKRRFGGFVSVQSCVTFSTFLEKVFGDQQKEICEVAIQANGHAPLWARIEASVVDEQRKVARAVVIDISERKQMEEQLRYLGTHDELTGLYNRSFFMEEMARLERGRDYPISIMMADLDYLKITNDEYGHAAGDDLLKRVAQALTTAFRADDVVARIGGDEFSVLLPATDATAAEVLLGRVQRVIQENNTDHTGIPIHLSLGVSTARNPAPLSALLQEADANMYLEKGEHSAAEK
jgi:diguanylate cyclase (GGDEF)-like protein/PAS domain S-box-containing protein